jgi:hypothetical protein
LRSGTLDALVEKRDEILRGDGQQRISAYQGGKVTNLAVWLPSTFFLGLVVMGLWDAFLLGCEKI